MTQTVTRSGWGARPPKAQTALPWPQVDAIAIHYSAAMSDEVPDYASRVRGIQNFHMDTNGWSDIAYSHLVSRTGIKFVGRGWGTQTAATLHHNDHTQAICFLGADKDGRDDVTDSGRRAISELIYDAAKLSGKRIGIAHQQHGITGFLAIGGHKDFVSTDCPGAELYHFITLRGWEAYAPKPPVIPYPPKFFLWAAWKLGEGAFKPYGPSNQAVRPKGLPRITPLYWLALRRFKAARKGT